MSLSTTLDGIITALSTAASTISTGATGAESARVAIISALNAFIDLPQNKIPTSTKLSALSALVTSTLSAIEVEDGISQSDVDNAVAALDAAIVDALTPIKNSLQTSAATLTAAV
jgi:hypothetical protein